MSWCWLKIDTFVGLELKLEALGKELHKYIFTKILFHASFLGVEGFDHLKLPGKVYCSAKEASVV